MTHTWIDFLRVSLALCCSCVPALAQPVTPPAQSPQSSYDIVIYGGTSAAVTAAVQAKQMGKSVVVVSPDRHLGGLTSGGLGWTDSGRKEAIGGLSLEFYQRVWDHYQQAGAWKWEDQAKFGNRNQSLPGAEGGKGDQGDGGERGAMWVFEPHVAEAIFEAWIKEHQVPVFRDEWLNRETGVEKRGSRIQSITTLSGKIFRGRMFIDATYEGDLLAAADVSYHVGREANSVYGETYNGNQVGVLHHRHWFMKPVDPYRTPGDPTSGLLPGVSADPPGVRGEADRRLQAYCFRMCLTQVEANRIPFPKPAGYDPARYELLGRVFDTGWRETFQKFDRMPNHKTDTNNHGPVSTDHIGANYEYPEASYERRQEIIRDHIEYQQGLMYFMANDPRAPEDVRSQMSQWGLCKDEFPDHGGWPHQLYIREARRMVGHYVMTEHDCLDRKPTPDSIGMGSYTLDSHNVRRYVTEAGTVQNEGDIGVRAPRPYEIAYGAVLPRRDECQNLLAPVCVSSSHIAFGSIRMEPVFMILGQSSTTAASISLDRDIALQDLPYPELQRQLLKDGQVLQWEDPNEIMAARLKGIVVDDAQAQFKGAWRKSSANQKFVNAGYQHNNNESPGDKSATFTAPLAAGKYEVRMSYSPNGNRGSQVPVEIHHLGGVFTTYVDQRKPPPLEKLFISLGVFEFKEKGTVVIKTTGADGYVVVDAVQWLKQ